MLARSTVGTRGRRICTVLLAGLATLGTAGAVSQAAPATAFVRVNQVGYPGAADKRAYLMSSTDLTGTAFTVRNGSNQVVLTGNVGSSLGSWNRAYSFVHPLDFNTLTTPGTYTVAVSGPPAATSPPFRIDTGPNVYRGALANALSFYQAERDGANYVPGPLRTAPAHLNDANAMTYLTPNANPSGRFSGDLTPLGTRIDASGGWWDAGDYIKGVQTLGYTTAMLLHGVRELPAQMAPFTAEAKFGTDWLLRMWDDPTRTFYYQVGIGTGNAKTVGDHDLWRLPQADDTFGGSDPAYRYIRNRPVFRAAPPGSRISPNLAGRDAAVFGLCYQAFKATDPAFANRCLFAGAHIFDLADTNRAS
jgi:endoglucanase